MNDNSYEARHGWTRQTAILMIGCHAIELFTRNVQTGRRTVATPYVGVYRQPGAPAVEGASKQAGR